MAVLEAENLLETELRRAEFRITNVSSKLNRRELEQLDTLAMKRGLQRGELIRQLILRELQQDGDGVPPTSELTEIVGLRLILLNFLKPLVTGERLKPEMFDAIMAEIRRSKSEVATKLLQQAGGQ